MAKYGSAFNILKGLRGMQEVRTLSIQMLCAARGAACVGEGVAAACVGGAAACVDGERSLRGTARRPYLLRGHFRVMRRVLPATSCLWEMR